MKKDTIDTLINSAIDAVIESRPPTIKVAAVVGALLDRNPLLRNADAAGLTRRVEYGLACRFDPLWRYQIEREDFLRGRPESALVGKEREAYSEMCARQGRALLAEAEELRAYMKARRDAQQ